MAVRDSQFPTSMRVSRFSPKGQNQREVLWNVNSQSYRANAMISTFQKVLHALQAKSLAVHTSTSACKFSRYAGGSPPTARTYTSSTALGSNLGGMAPACRRSHRKRGGSCVTKAYVLWKTTASGIAHCSAPSRSRHKFTDAPKHPCTYINPNSMVHTSISAGRFSRYAG
jgi:hypothetical protein